MVSRLPLSSSSTLLPSVWFRIWVVRNMVSFRVWRIAMLSVCRVCGSVAAGWTMGALPSLSDVCWKEAVSFQHLSLIQAFGCNGSRVIPATTGYALCLMECSGFIFDFSKSSSLLTVSVSECGFPSLILAGQGGEAFGSVRGLGWGYGFAAGLVATLAAQDHEEAELPKLLAVGLCSPCDDFQDNVFSASAAMLAAIWAAISSCTWASVRAAAAFCQSEFWASVSAASAAAFLPCCSLKNFGKAEGKIQSTHCLCEVMALFPQVWYLLLRDGHVLGLRFGRTSSSAAAAFFCCPLGHGCSPVLQLHCSRVCWCHHISRGLCVVRL